MSASLTLLRIPLTIAAAYALHTAATPPTPPPPKDEQKHRTSLIELLAPRFPILVKLLYWAVALAESAVILARAFPHHPLSNIITNTFVVPQTGDASLAAAAARIRITLLFFVGFASSVFGMLLRLACYRALGSRFTFELSIRPGHTLYTGGPYAYVRHPSYTGAILAGSGATLADLSAGSYVVECLGPVGRWAQTLGAVFCAVVTLAFVMRMRREDEMMRAEFKEKWDQWAARVPYWLVPYVL